MLRDKKLNLFIILAIILLPFNDLPYLRKVFGEISSEGAFYPLLIGMLIFYLKIISNKKITFINSKSFKIIFIFLIWTLISAIFNLNNILDNVYKNRTGVERFILSLFILIFCILVSNFIYLMLNKYKTDMFYIRKIITISFIIPGIYAFIEILRLGFRIDYISNYMDFIGEIIRGKEWGFSQYYKLRSVSGEASWYSMYIAFIFPWTLSYVFTEKHNLKYILLNIYILLTIAYTYSRTGYIVIAIEFIIFNVLYLKQHSKSIYKKIYATHSIILISIFIIILVIYKLDLSNNLISLLDKNNISNITRFTSQKISLDLGINNFVFGVGLGQYAFYFKDIIKNYPINDELYTVLISNIWPATHNIYCRIFCELGIIGLVIWGYIWINLLKNIIDILKKSDNINNIIQIV
ncbi:O-antigen ligase family protein, partial [Clostridium novyi]|uniref:O-antigen ligase family protein n=1 Tax=Clostridium novyi TaxID=1542 RepID=UPI0004D86C8B